MSRPANKRFLAALAADRQPAPPDAKPVRLHLSRAKGFSLQEHSRAINGLPAVNVARPSKWGNPFVIEPVPNGGRYRSGGRAAEYRQRLFQVVEMFRGMLANGKGVPWAAMARDLPELRGKNLACWCAEGEKVCHAQVLLEVANREEVPCSR